jgi:autotransporter adhesin
MTYPVASAFLDPGHDGDGDQTFHDQWEFTISNVEDVGAPTVELTEDEAAEVVPTAPKASPFILTEGGVKLAASATLAAALAFSLY